MCEKPNASDLMRFLINIKMKVKNRSHIYDINRTRPRHGHKYNKHKKCCSIIMLICISNS